MLLFRNDPLVRLVDEFFETRTPKTQSGYVHVYRNESEEEYSLDLIVPSLTKDDINIIVEEDLLKISYVKTEESTSFMNSFERSYTLPEDINEKKISAKVENGVLNVKIPKLKKKNSQRTISVS